MQENPSKIPPGEVPRQLELYLEGSQVDLLKNGDHVAIIGIFLTRASPGSRRGGVKIPFIKVVGISKNRADPEKVPWSEEDEDSFKKFARGPDVLGVFSKSIVPGRL